MGMQLGLYAAPSGALLYDFSHLAQNLTFSRNEHGDEALRCHVPLSLTRAFQVYDQVGLHHVALTSNGQTVWEGRLEDITLTDEGVDLTALGYWRALSDVPYTALWSSTSLAVWKPTDAAEITNHSSERYQFEQGGGVIKIMPRKGEVFGSALPLYGGSVLFRSPIGTTRNPSGVQFSYELRAPAGWTAALEARGDDPNTYLGAVWSLNGNGGTQVGAVVTSTNADTLDFTLYYNGSATSTAETGDIYVKFWNVRIVTDTSRQVNTATSGIVSVGSNVTVTPLSMANITVGQLLAFGIPGIQSENVTVLSKTATTFTVTTGYSWGNGTPIKGYTVTADSIAANIVSLVSSVNSTQLHNDTSRIQSPGIDLRDELYEEVDPASILERLIGLGDDQAAPRQWEVGVEERRLYFRPRGSAGRTWYVDALSLQAERTLDQITNSVYATYEDASGITRRTATNTDTASVAHYGVIRRSAVSAKTTSAVQASIHRDAALADRKVAIPRARITFDAVYDATGARWPLWMVRSGDTITIRNLPPTLSTDIDRIRTFRINRTEYDVETRSISVEPESPLPTLDAMLARREA